MLDLNELGIDLKIIANRVKNAREFIGSVTQEELAELAGVSRHKIEKAEKGEEFPDLDTIKKIAAAYNYTWKKLLGLTEKQAKIIEEFYVSRSPVMTDDYTEEEKEIGRAAMEAARSIRLRRSRRKEKEKEDAESFLDDIFATGPIESHDGENFL